MEKTKFGKDRSLCSTEGCENPAFKWFRSARYRGKTYYSGICRRCWKIKNMWRHAHESYRHEKISKELIGALLELVENDGMRCPHCRTQMELFGKPLSRVATLQHYDDGGLGIICYACNTKHGDSRFGDRIFRVPEGFKLCSRCGRELPVTNFGRNRHTKCGLQSICYECYREYDRMRRPRKNP